MAAVGAWPVPRAPDGRRAGVAVFRSLIGRRGGLAGPRGFVWPLWGRCRSGGSSLVLSISVARG